jgi:hypothetical protein
LCVFYIEWWRANDYISLSVCGYVEVRVAMFKTPKAPAGRGEAERRLGRKPKLSGSLARQKSFSHLRPAGRPFMQLYLFIWPSAKWMMMVIGGVNSHFSHYHTVTFASAKHTPRVRADEEVILTRAPSAFLQQKLNLNTELGVSSLSLSKKI